MPRFQQTAQRLRTEQTAFGLAQLFRYAHERAVIQGHPMAWVWDAQTRQARVAHVAEDGQRGEWLTEHTARTRPVHGSIEVTLARADAEVEAVTFLPDGTSDGGILRIDHRPFRYTVTVDAITSQPHLSASTATQ